MVPVSGFAQTPPIENVDHGYAGAEAGDWGGKNGAVIGPADNTCANMGAVNKVNLVSNFGFNIPTTATITEVRAFTKAGAGTVQNVNVQLASIANVDPPTTIGNVVTFPFPGVGSGNCASTIVSDVGNGLGFWGLTSLSPATVNSPAFGMVFTKVQTSEIKVDSICMQISYETASGPAVQRECFAPPPANQLTVTKTVVGTPPGTDWEFNGSPTIGPFTLPAAGGGQTFDLADGTYTITETTKPGYLVSSECLINGQVVATGNEQISVELTGNNTVATCFFTNTEAIPAITVVKSSTTTGLSAPQTVNYSYLVTNTGNVPITGLALSDDNDNNDMSCGSTTIAVGGSTTCTATHTFTQAELDANGSPTPGSGVLFNTVTASSNEAPDATDNLSIPITQSPSLTVAKSSTTTSLSAPQTVTYSYLVTNTGNVTITGLSLSDDNDNNDMSCGSTTIAVGGSTTCTATHTFTQAELDANGSPTAASGVLFNTVTASSNEAPDATDNLSIPITQTASLTIDKTSATTSLSAPQTVTYNYLVTNTGNVTITGLLVNDTNVAAPPVCGSTTLTVAPDAGSTTTCTATHTFTQAELDDYGSPTAGSGELYNMVRATSNEAPDATDELSIPIVGNPSISMVKSADTVEIAEPGVVTYYYEVTNTGNVSLTGIYVDDDNDEDDASCPVTVLAPGASTTCTATHVVTADEVADFGSPIAGSGEVFNNATAYGTPPRGAPVSASDSLSIPILFFEGIPTLSNLGMALMALLMLGIGLVGFRRFF